MARRKTPINTNKAGVLLSNSDNVSAIVGNLKRAFSRSPTVVDFLKSHRREEIWFKKDGSKAKRPKVFYKCFKCQQEFNSTQIQVDHIEPVIPLNIPTKHLSYNTLVDRLFCDIDNLQILCKEHHAEKSAEENRIRQEWLVKTKYIVYETVNKTNQKKYIGVHKCEDYDDGYMGSGVLLKAALSKYGKQNFYRHILHVYDNADQAFLKEKELVTLEIAESDHYYNLTEGGQGGSYEYESSKKISVICHQTSEIFDSISSASNAIDVSISSVSKALDDPNQPVKNYHFFTLETYDPKISVTYPKIGKTVYHLNSKTQYDSLEMAAKNLNLNYKSLRNAMLLKNDMDYCSLDGQYFLYSDDFDPSITYYEIVKKILCVEKNISFDSVKDAAYWLKHPKVDFCAIAIRKAIRQNSKMYGYTWQELVTKTPI